MAENNTVLRSGFNAKLRAEADAVLSDTVFRRSPVLSKLLRYLVEETAQGRADKLKSFIVATQGLGRPDNFDPASDSSARVQMVRLRKTLENHYAQHGPADDLCIYLQPGCYIVRLAKLSTAYPMLYRPLSDRQETPKSVLTEAITPEIVIQLPSGVIPVSPTLLAAAGIPVPRKRRAALIASGMLIGLAIAFLGWFGWQHFGANNVSVNSPILELMPVDAGENPALASTARQISATFADDLPRFKISRVRMMGTGIPRREAATTDRVYRLSSRLENGTPNGQKLFLNLTDAKTSTALWSRELALPADEIAAAKILVPILAEINGSFGVVAMHETKIHQNSKSGGYPCLLKYFEFVRTRAVAVEDKVAACFEKPVKEPRMEATILAARALFAFERRSANADFAAATTKAIGFARAAVAADPNDGSANFALARLSYLREDCVSARFYTRRAVEDNPASPIIVATLAALANTCRYPEADKLLDLAFLAQSPDYSKGRLLLTLAALGQDRPDMLAEINDSDLPQTRYNRINYYLVETLIAASQGKRADAARYWQLFSNTIEPGPRTADEKLMPIVAIPAMRKRLIAFLEKGGAFAQ